MRAANGLECGEPCEPSACLLPAPSSPGSTQLHAVEPTKNALHLSALRCSHPLTVPSTAAARCWQIEFRLFGFIPGAVGLRGSFISIPEREGGENRQDTVKVRCCMEWASSCQPSVLDLLGSIRGQQTNRQRNY